MKNLIVLMVISLLLGGCRVKKVSTTKEQNKIKTERKLSKDSTATIKTENTIHSIEGSFDLELESTKDSVYFERYKDGNKEVILVKGGKLSLKSKTKENSLKTDSIATSKVVIKEDLKQIQQEIKKVKTKDVKSYSFFSWLLLIIVVLLFILLYIYYKVKSKL